MAARFRTEARANQRPSPVGSARQAAPSALQAAAVPRCAWHSPGGRVPSALMAQKRCAPAARHRRESSVPLLRETEKAGLAPETRSSKARQTAPPPAKQQVRWTPRDSREAWPGFREPGPPLEAKWEARPRK